MLKYFELVTGDLVSAGLLLSIILSFFRFNYGKRAKNIFLSGTAFSFVISIVFAVFAIQKRTTHKLNLGKNSIILYWAIIITAVVFAVLLIEPLRNLPKKLGKKLSDKNTAAKFIGICLSNVFDILMFFAGTLVVMLQIFYYVPDAVAYPWNFDLGGESVWSTDFAFKIIGCLLGVLLVVIASISAYKVIKSLSRAVSRIVIILSVLVNSCYFAGEIVRFLIQRRKITPLNPGYGFFFDFMSFTNNASSFFILAVVCLAVVCAVVLFVKNTKVRGEYSNSAQLRKLKAAMRKCRKWAIIYTLCAAMVFVNLTVFHEINNQKPIQAPVEDAKITDSDVIVNLEQVSDGELHRFGYKTESGTEVLFIVIKKPNSSAYGVGLDACEICGDAGYYQRGKEVVCSKCDVVMNINTIGFKGGCNPIIIDYEVKNGKIFVPIKTLVEHEKDFR